MDDNTNQETTPTPKAEAERDGVPTGAPEDTVMVYAQEPVEGTEEPAREPEAGKAADEDEALSPEMRERVAALKTAKPITREQLEKIRALIAAELGENGACGFALFVAQWSEDGVNGHSMGAASADAEAVNDTRVIGDLNRAMPGLIVSYFDTPAERFRALQSLMRAAMRERAGAAAGAGA